MGDSHVDAKQVSVLSLYTLVALVDLQWEHDN